MWNRSCSVVNRRKTELSFAHARFLLRHYAHARTDRAGIPDRVPTVTLKVVRDHHLSVDCLIKHMYFPS